MSVSMVPTQCKSWAVDNVKHIILSDVSSILDVWAGAISLPKTTEPFWRSMCTQWTMVQTLYLEVYAVYQHDNAPIHKARLLTEWFDEHES